MWNDQGGFNEGGGFGESGGFNSPGGFGTPQQAEGRKGRSRAQNIVPVTVAQVLNASTNDDRFFTGNLEISQVSLLGLIRGVNESSNKIEYEFDDMTGPLLAVRQFVDNDENVPDEERIQTMRENTYVRVCGHVRSFQGKRHVVAFNITPVEDMNQLSCHLLSVVHALASTNAAQASNNDVQFNAGAGTSHAGDFGASNNFGMSSLHNQIATIIKSSNSELGVSIADVARQMKGVPEKAIRDAVEFLSGEGHIYSTIDDDHFKATDG